MPLLDSAKSVVSRAVKAQKSPRMAPQRLPPAPWGGGLQAPLGRDKARRLLSLHQEQGRAGTSWLLGLAGAHLSRLPSEHLCPAGVLKSN